MGRYSNSNFGDISGKVGNAVGSNWRGIKYMRGLQKDPRTHPLHNWHSTPNLLWPPHI